MTEEEFGLMTPRAFFNKLSGFSKSRKENYQAEWERSRWMVCQLVNISMKSVKRNLRLTDIVRFSWEKVERTEKDVKRDQEAFEEAIKKHGKKWLLN